MKLANLNDRAHLVVGDSPPTAVDVATASNGAFGPDLASIYADWAAFVEWASSADLGDGTPFANDELGAPSPNPKQVFAVGLNYAGHAAESGMALPEVPAVFTKFPASLGAPNADVVLSGPMVDWEVELVVVIGRTAAHVTAADAWDHIAGLCVGQDISDRMVQFAAGAQFSLGKSFRSFGPTGPWLVTPDEFANPNDLGLGCSIDGETVQDDRTSDLIFDVPELIQRLSAIVDLWPGDLIFTGTPAGVGVTRQPARFLEAGQILESWIEGIGTIRNTIVAGAQS